MVEQVFLIFGELTLFWLGLLHCSLTLWLGRKNVHIFLILQIYIKNYWKITIFQNFCSNFTGDVCLEVYSNKSNFIQVLESNYIDSNGLYSQKRLTLKNQLIAFAS